MIPEEAFQRYPSVDPATVGRAVSTSARPTPRSLSERVWGIHWAEHLPISLDNEGATLEFSDYETVTAFARENLSRIFELDARPNPFLQVEGHSLAKERFQREAVDFFVVRVAGKIVGIHTANLTDWSTYYLRHSSLLPEFEGRRYLNKYISFMLEVLGKYPVARVQLETSSTNLKILQITSRYRFCVTGTQASERWGNVLLLTRFLDSECERTYLNQYCFGNHPK